MAGRGNPSFLKNQKAKKRQERATEKRAARAAGESGSDPSEFLAPGEPADDTETASENEA